MDCPTPGTQGQLSAATSGRPLPKTSGSTPRLCKSGELSSAQRDAPVRRLTLPVTAGLYADFQSISFTPVVRELFVTLKICIIIYYYE